MTHTAANVLKNDSDFQEVMKATGIGALLGLKDIRYVTPQVIAAVIGADEVYIATGDAAQNWSDNLVTPFVIVDPALPPRAVPQLGRRITYVFDDGIGNDESWIACQQLADPSTRSTDLDFIVYDNALLFNASNYLGTSLKVASS